MLIASLCACNLQEAGTPDRGLPDIQAGAETVTTEMVLYSPHSAAEYTKMDYVQVEQLLKDAGFSDIELCPLDDITSDSDIPDGTVESVCINGVSDFTKDTSFHMGAVVVITYHNIPKIGAPISQEAAKTMHYMEVGKLFFDAGFTNIITDEIYDLPVGSDTFTELTAN
jgi:hypothetical protein